MKYFFLILLIPTVACAGTHVQYGETLTGGATSYVQISPVSQQSGAINVSNATFGDTSTANPLILKSVAGSHTDATLIFQGSNSTNGDGIIDYYSDPSTLFSRLQITNSNLNSGVTEKRYKAGWNFVNSSGKISAYINSNTTGSTGNLALPATGQITLFDGPTSKFVALKASDTITNSNTLVLPDSVATAVGSLLTVKSIVGTAAAIQYYDLLTSPFTVSTMTYMTGMTGGGSALLGANCPATTATAPYTWFQMKSADGSIVYVPAWK